MITALADGKPFQAFRHNRASAMCLADDWAEAGYKNVRIVDPDGVEHGREQFRETVTMVKKARRRALAL